MFKMQSGINQEHQAHKGKFAFAAQTADELVAWQQTFRAELANLLGLADRPLPQSFAVELVASTDFGSYVEEKYAFTMPDGPMPVYLLVPKAAPPYKLIMAFHGHGPGVRTILGSPPEPNTEQTVSDHNNFAQVLAQEGYLVCAIEQRGFGERITDQVSNNQNSCRHLAFDYMMHGKILLGERLFDAMTVISWLQQRDDIVPGIVGNTGHSGGGTTALYLAALDDRITTSVVGGYFCDYYDSILGMSHCECNYVPGLLPLGDVADVGTLITPQPLRFINGEVDPIFPIEGVQKAYKVVERAYSLAGASDACSLHIHPDGHRYDLAAAIEWFKAWL
ncbi:MAG: acetylxylan esterase [Anaerolineaceae bacterium]|nr:acetylxylan esterase [Anaerolineaceae bacterium]